MTTIRLLVFLLVFSTSAHAATYYISPTGSNANAGTSAGAPWLTFAYALDGTRASCGDTLILLDGTYGDGTSTGKINLTGRVCTLGNELIIQAQNSRQAKIVDNGTYFAVRMSGSAYITFDGLYARSTDNNYRPSDTGELGFPFGVYTSNHVTFRNNIAVQTNRYGNTHAYLVDGVQDVLLEDNEAYTFARHCVTAFKSERVVVRRQYCNPRGGGISGGVGPLTLGGADTIMSMYPCKDCILENSIADGTTNPMPIAEMNANFNSSVLMSGSKVLGSIGYRSNISNGIYPNSRTAVGLNYAPQNITIKDVALVDWGSPSSGIKCEGCVNMTVDHFTILGTGTTGTGIWALDDTQGGTAAQNSIFITNTIIKGVTPEGFLITGHDTWSGDEVWSNGNGTAFSPALPANWTNASTSDPGYGTCKLWLPDGAAAKGTGTGGSDPGATILYRYVDGVLTTVPLWDPITGKFPYGAATADGINRVAGESIDSIHTRLNVNTGGCSFPAGYGGGGGGASTVVKGTTAVSGTSVTATPLTWNHTIAANQDMLLACFALFGVNGGVGSVSGVEVTGGSTQAMTLVRRETSSAGHRAAELWKLASPASGARTLTATLTGTITAALGRSTEYAGTSGLQTPVGIGSTGTATSLSVTAETNTNELVSDCTASSKNVTYTHGSDQTGETDLSHSTQALLLAVSHQDGSNGGIMSHSTGGSVYQAKVAVSLIAGTPDPPSTATLTQSDYLFLYPTGTEAGSPPIASWLSDTNAKNLPIYSRPNGYMRIRAMIEGGVATTSPFGVALFCRKNAESYTQVIDTFGSTIFRLYGPGVTPDVPSSLTATSNRLCSASCVTGAILRDQSSSFVVQALTIGQKIELDSVVVFQAAAGNTANCRYQKDDGTVFDTYSNTPLITFTEDAAGAP